MNRTNIKSTDGLIIAWPECHIDAEPGQTTCGSYCSTCSISGHRAQCLEDRLEIRSVKLAKEKPWKLKIIIGGSGGGFLQRA